MNDYEDNDYDDDDPFFGPWDDEFGPWDEDEEEYDDEEYDDVPCSHCGPSCPDWAGDGLCMIEIRYQAVLGEFYDTHYKLDLQTCPICGKVLTLYKVPCDLWHWPGDWLPPIIALEVYAVYDCPKGIVHSFGKDLHHVWIGSGEPREHLIATNCIRLEPEAEWIEAKVAEMEAADRGEYA